MARCSWEAGIDITGGSQPEDEAFDLPQQEEPKSCWSTDSSADIVFAAPSQGDDSSWVPYAASGATWGADSDLRTNTPSECSASFLTYDDRRTPSSSFSMYSPALSGPYVSTQGDEESTFVDGSERLKPQALSVTTASELYEGSIVMRSVDSATMHTALESPVTYSSFFLQSSVSVSKPSFAAPSAFEVGISTFDEDEERLRDSMSWTQASAYDQRTHAESDLVNVSSMDLSPTEQEHTTIGHSTMSSKQWQDFYSVTPVPQPQVHCTRLPFPLVPLKSSPATSTPFQSPSPTPANPRATKPRSSSFFNPIKFAFPPRHPSPAPSVPKRRSAPASANVFTPLPSPPTEKWHVPNWCSSPTQRRSKRVDDGAIVSHYVPHGTGSSQVNFSRPPQRRPLRVEHVQQHDIYQFSFRSYPNPHVPTLEHTTVYYPQNPTA
ncbi:hypothetical protein B0F90DRAFT_683488 [Multifurca ochricompacta]|uniref:Uncharacterized protein n=1 Tax=Multifurca ochricompacta TaxID=376703 RepID=A0AAD4QME6_9AGAM|nr:hypothetical protein B0F90DRAFT_683488 [Multifurca ochricompacta]